MRAPRRSATLSSVLTSSNHFPLRRASLSAMTSAARPFLTGLWWRLTLSAMHEGGICISVFGSKHSVVFLSPAEQSMLTVHGHLSVLNCCRWVNAVMYLCVCHMTLIIVDARLGFTVSPSAVWPLRAAYSWAGKKGSAGTVSGFSSLSVSVCCLSCGCFLCANGANSPALPLVSLSISLWLFGCRKLGFVFVSDLLSWPFFLFCIRTYWNSTCTIINQPVQTHKTKLPPCFTTHSSLVPLVHLHPFVFLSFPFFTLSFPFNFFIFFTLPYASLSFPLHFFSISFPLLSFISFPFTFISSYFSFFNSFHFPVSLLLYFTFLFFFLFSFYFISFFFHFFRLFFYSILFHFSFALSFLISSNFLRGIFFPLPLSILFSYFPLSIFLSVLSFPFLSSFSISSAFPFFFRCLFFFSAYFYFCFQFLSFHFLSTAIFFPFPIFFSPLLSSPLSPLLSSPLLSSPLPLASLLFSSLSLSLSSLLFSSLLSLPLLSSSSLSFLSPPLLLFLLSSSLLPLLFLLFLLSSPPFTFHFFPENHWNSQV